MTVHEMLKGQITSSLHMRNSTYERFYCRVNKNSSSLRPNISMHILYTVLCTCPKMLTRRIRLKIKSFSSEREIFVTVDRLKSRVKMSTCYCHHVKNSIATTYGMLPAI